MNHNSSNTQTKFSKAGDPTNYCNKFSVKNYYLILKFFLSSTVLLTKNLKNPLK